MPRLSSAARKKGVWQDWMLGATDLGGTAYPQEGAVDLGAYQCTLISLGTTFLLR